MPEYSFLTIVYYSYWYFFHITHSIIIRLTDGISSSMPKIYFRCITMDKEETHDRYCGNNPGQGRTLE